jgi:hypothetical protein
MLPLAAADFGEEISQKKKPGSFDPGFFFVPHSP